MVLYEDRYLVLSETELTIKNFYAPFSSKTVEYAEITNVYEEPLNFWSGKWRFGGPRRLPQWFHVDLYRPGKEKCIVVETSGTLDPVLTPEHHTQVLAILRHHVGGRFSAVVQEPNGVGPIGLAPLGHFPFRLRRWGSPCGLFGARLLCGKRGARRSVSLKLRTLQNDRLHLRLDVKGGNVHTSGLSSRKR